jgi:nitrate/nitrite transporter NarK
MMERHLSILKMGAIASVPFLAKVPMVMVAGRLSDSCVRRYGHAVLVRKLFVSAGFILGSSILLLQCVDGQMAILGILVLSLLGIAVGSANYWALTQAITPAFMSGRIIGAQNTIGNLAGICAPVLTGWLVSRTGGFSAAIWFAGVSLLVAASAYLFVVREHDGNKLRADLSCRGGLYGEASQ